DRLAFRFRNMPKDHVGAIADLHSLRPAGADCHARGRKKGRRRSNGGRLEPGTWAEHLRRLFGNQSLEHQLIGLFESVLNVIAKPPALAVERVERSEDV